MRRAALALLALGGAAFAAAAAEPPPGAGTAAAEGYGAAPDSAAADSAAADSAAADTTQAPPPPPFRPDPAASALGLFRPERSVDVEVIPFGEPDDPQVRPGFQTLADVLRLQPSLRTRELSNGPTVETFGLDGTGSGRSDLLLGSRSLRIPGTSGPFTNEVMLSEVGSVLLLRGGAAALYGPDASAGALVVDPAFPVPEELTTRAFAEEGVDGYERAGIWLANHWRDRMSVFLDTESRRVDGFFPGTKEVDRHFTARVAGRLPWGLQGMGTYRRYEGDGRFNGFDPGEIGSVLTKRTDWEAGLFRATGEGRGVLFEAMHAGERLENILPPDSASSGITTREIDGPLLRLTADLPSFGSLESTARLEGGRWSIAREEAGETEKFRHGAAALRVTLGIGPGAGLTGTARLDGEEGRRTARQARAEAWWTLGELRLFGVGSRDERRAPRGAAGRELEVSHAAQGGARLSLGSFEARAVGFVTVIEDFRPDPTFEQVRAREPALAAPIGDARIVGGDVGFATGRFGVPGVRFLGRFLLRTSVTLQEPEIRGTGEQLPGRPKRIWTGEGFLERPLFQGDLLARVRGRLTHWGDRVDDAGLPVIDLWLTDVILEGEIGDATFFYRFQDMPGRADEVEPGIRFPGFTRTYGITWRFRG